MKVSQRHSSKLPGAISLTAYTAIAILTLVLASNAPAADLGPTTAPAGSLAREGPIRVGVIISQQTSQHGWFASYKMVGRTFRDGLKDDAFDFYAVVEPDTEPLEDLPPDVAANFRNHSTIDCTDAEAMRQLDVIVAPGVSNLTPAMLDGVERAVRDDGVGLLVRLWFGEAEPGLTPRVLALHGLTAGQYGWNPKDQACVVADADHPILKDLVKPGDRLMLEPNGAYGVRSGGVLIGLADPASIVPTSDGATTQPATQRADFVAAPLSVATFGKGRIVCCLWLGHHNDPRTVETLRSITTRSIRWLAGRAEPAR